MATVYDCFTFFNEVELLKFRTRYLKNVVDYFIIVEGSETHSGNNKPQNFSYDIIDEDIRHKVKYFYIDFPKGDDLLDHLDFNADYIMQTRDSWKSWARENYQRNYIRKCLTNASENDIILVSDIDEIIFAHAIQYLKDNPMVLQDHKILSLAQIPFYYTVYNPWKISLDESSDIWYHPKATLYKNMIRPNLTRMGRAEGILNGAGWHFGYFGDNNRIKTKKQSVATHSNEISDQEKKVLQNIANREGIIQNTKKIEKDILQKEFNLPDLVFTKDFINFFSGGIN